MIKINRNTDTKLDFELSYNSIDISIINSVRRAIISEVNTFAIEKVIISKNNGVMKSDIVAHRLGLIPLKVSENIDDISDNFEFIIELDVEYDQNKADNNNIQTIYSGDMKMITDGISLVYNDIILTKIKKGQSLCLKAVAVKGNGMIHNKWSPSCGTLSKISEDKINFYVETKGSLTPSETILKFYKNSKRKC